MALCEHAFHYSSTAGHAGDAGSGFRIPTGSRRHRNRSHALTGTKDAGFTRTWLRQTAYDKIKSPGTCFVNFKGAEHFSFGDPLQPSGNAKVAILHPLVLTATTAFWDAHLRDDPGAKAWLEQAASPGL